MSNDLFCSLGNYILSENQQHILDRHCGNISSQLNYLHVVQLFFLYSSIIKTANTFVQYGESNKGFYLKPAEISYTWLCGLFLHDLRVTARWA